MLWKSFPSHAIMGGEGSHVIGLDRVVVEASVLSPECVIICGWSLRGEVEKRGGVDAGASPTTNEETRITSNDTTLR